MSDALQVALILATLALTVLLVVLAQLVIHARKKIDTLAGSVEALSAKLEATLSDSRELIQNVTVISTRVQADLDEVDRVLHTARLWTDRADRLVEEVTAVVEPPVQALAGTGHVLRAGAGAFFRSLFSMNGGRSVPN